MEQMKDFVKGMYQKKHLGRRLVLVNIAVILMGFALSWLVLVDMGTDPYTCMNLAMAAKLHTTLGNWQALLNVVLFLIVFIFGKSNIGFGTVANMLLVGYSCDFFSWIWEKILPGQAFDSMGIRLMVLFPALILFIFAAAVYMDMELGTSPYDAISFIIADHLKKVPFRLVRIGYDTFFMILGIILGGRFGIVTLVMAFTLGPVISFVGEKIKKVLEF